MPSGHVGLAANKRKAPARLGKRYVLLEQLGLEKFE